MDILFTVNDAPGAETYKDTIVKTVTAAAAAHGFVNAIIDITVTNNGGIREINKKYRVDSITDCLSFPQYEKDELKTLAKTSRLLLGDVVISLEKAQEQAQEYGHSTGRELSFLALHSTLHLLGYDHAHPEDEREMINKQDEILNLLGITR